MKERKNSHSFRQFTFLMIFALMLAMTIVILSVASWDSNSIMKKEARERNVNAATQMQCTYDVIFRQLNQLNNYDYLDVNVQTFMNSDVPENFYQEFAGGFSELTKTYRYVQNYIYEIGFYASEEGSVWTSALENEYMSIPKEQYVDNSVCDYINEMQPFGNGYYYHRYADKHPYVMTLIKKNKEGTGDVCSK